MSRAENIGNLPPGENFIKEGIKKDRMTLAERLLIMGNTAEAKECYIGAGMSPKQADEMIKFGNFLGRK